MTALARPELLALKSTIPGVGCDLFATPMTLGDLDKINAIKRKLSISDEQIGHAIVITVIHKLRTKDGALVFQMSDREELLNCVPMGILTDVANEIGDAGTADKKNS